MDGIVVCANKKASQLCGQELKGSNCRDLFHLGISPCPHETVLSTLEGARAEWSTGSGDVLTVTVDPIVDASGAATGFVRVMSELPEKQEILEEAVDASRMAMLGRMLSGTAHDLGTPLNIILGYTEYLLMRTRPDAAGYRELSTILEQTKRISDSIRKMLDLGRGGRTDAIGLKGFLDESIGLLAREIRKVDVSVRVTCNANAPLIYGDAPQLRQAFINLLLIASQRVGRGGEVEIVLDESVDDSARGVAISFIGTEAGGRGHNFAESFANLLHPADRAVAMGSGFLLAREILNSLGARLDAVDVGELGSSLVVYLPRGNGQATPGGISALR
jgi:signal transduction histidine kinase